MPPGHRSATVDRLLGQDDFAIRPRHDYATILIDIVTGRTPADRPETGLATRTRERFAAVQDLPRRGVSRAGVRRHCTWTCNTMRRYAEATTVDELLVNTRRDSLIDPYRTYLHQR